MITSNTAYTLSCDGSHGRPCPTGAQWTDYDTSHEHLWARAAIHGWTRQATEDPQGRHAFVHRCQGCSSTEWIPRTGEEAWARVTIVHVYPHGAPPSATVRIGLIAPLAVPPPDRRLREPGITLSVPLADLLPAKSRGGQ